MWEYPFQVEPAPKNSPIIFPSLSDPSEIAIPHWVKLIIVTPLGDCLIFFLQRSESRGKIDQSATTEFFKTFFHRAAPALRFSRHSYHLLDGESFMVERLLHSSKPSSSA